MTDQSKVADPALRSIQCPVCKGRGSAWQWRTYGDHQYHVGCDVWCERCKGDGVFIEMNARLPPNVLKRLPSLYAQRVEELRAARRMFWVVEGVIVAMLSGVILALWAMGAIK
jgi:hypothetical protein